VKLREEEEEETCVEEELITMLFIGEI